MNAYPPLPPFFPSQHRLPGHGPSPAQERRHRVEAVILPLEVHLARRFFPAQFRRAPPPAQAPAVASPDDNRPTPSLVKRLLARLFRALVRG